MATPTRNPHGLMATREHTKTVCPVWPGLCTDTEPGHYDHENHLRRRRPDPARRGLRTAHDHRSPEELDQADRDARRRNP